MSLKFSFLMVAMTVALAGTIYGQADQKAPEFSALDANGQKHTLSQYKGKVVVLEFTNPGSPTTGKPGCPYMVPRYEHKIMQGIAAKVQEKGGVYLAVNSAFYNTPADTKAVMQKYGFTYPTLMDQEGTIARAYHAKTTPHMFVIGIDGQLVYQGALDGNATPDTSQEAASEQYVLEAVDAAVAGKAPRIARTQPYGCAVKLK